MTREPPLELPGPTEREPGPVDEAVLAAYGMVEAAGLLSGVSLELWEHLPEDFCQDHELDRGRLIRRESGTPGHQSASLSIAIVLKSAARKAVAAEMYSCLRVSQDLDVRLWDVPCATIRKPDVLVYRCLEPGARRLWAGNVLPDDSAIATIQRFRLVQDHGVYLDAGTWTNGATAEAVRTDTPFPIEAAWTDLDF
ncbi:hypothetical protein GCM10009839_83210 [Catenulispora yoronensis]|uniref:Uncharacterized protein n=1 Tax=Catenulispora yoronensis TaxID=450799 RepID=A0ABN2VE37_9ACTN